MVSSYMWRFRRSDIKDRNEWFNYTNYPFSHQIPYDLSFTNYEPINGISSFHAMLTANNPSVNTKQIMVNAALLMDGYFRENLFDSGTYNYIEKYNRTTSANNNGIYHYHFCLDSNKSNKQPSGAMNTNKYNTFAHQITTKEPELCRAPENFIDILCNDDGEPIATRKNNADLYKYNYDLTVFEERYNVIYVSNGNVSLMYAR